MSNYKISDIEVGDGVYFKVDWHNNYDLYWTVKSKNETHLEIEINEMGANDRMWLNIVDVYSIERRHK